MDVQHRVTPDPQTRRRKIICKQELIIQSLQIFYSNRSDLVDLLKIIEGTTELFEQYTGNQCQFQPLIF